LDRLPPHSIEAEQGLLGCCLLNGDVVGDCLDKIRAEAFYDVRHRTLFEVLVAMFQKPAPIDVLTVTQWLKERGELEAVGGDAHLIALMDCVPSAANAPYYVEIVREKFLLRQLIKVCVESVGRAYECENEVDRVVDAIERDILAVNETRTAGQERRIREILADVIEQIEDYHRGGAQLLGLSTGFDYLDKMLLGLRGADLFVVAARPGMGKSSFGMQLVEHLAVDKRIPCGVFSLEMTALQLTSRLLFQRARGDYQRYRSGFMQNEDLPRLTQANLDIGGAPLYLDETGGLNVLQIRARARRWHRQYGIRFLLVDYIQLMRPSRYYQNREQEVAEMSGGLKTLAKELDIPIVVLAQLNREIEKSPNRRPQLADLRESGAIEQDADIVGFLYAPKLSAKELKEIEDRGTDWSDTFRRINLLIAKQRNGPTGDCQLLYRKKSMRFESAFPSTAPLPGTQRADVSTAEEEAREEGLL
jgi:replicative DNA helicase